MRILILALLVAIPQTLKAQVPIEERYPIDNYNYFVGTWEGTTDNNEKLMVIFDIDERVSSSDGQLKRYLVGQFSYFKNGVLVKSTIGNSSYAIDLGLLNKAFDYSQLRMMYVRGQDLVDRINLQMDGQNYELKWSITPFEIKNSNQKSIPVDIPSDIILRKVRRE